MAYPPLTVSQQASVLPAGWGFELLADCNYWDKFARCEPDRREEAAASLIPDPDTRSGTYRDYELWVPVQSIRRECIAER